MAPRFWMELMSLTTTFLFDSATEPFARHAVTIIGSISGVSPTAMLTANRAAPSHSPFVKPLMRNTTGTIASMKPMRICDTEFTPFSKAVFSVLPAERVFTVCPNRVPSPVAATMPTPLPLTTFVPMNARQLQFVSEPASHGSAFFSSGALSPVSADCATNKSFAATMRKSAGIISPAERCTSSPTASSDTGISFLPSPLRETQVVVVIIAESFSAAAPLRDSCTKRRMPDTATMTAITMTVM